MSLAPLTPVIAATWPAVSEQVVGPFTIPEGGGGGNRVSAARLTAPRDQDATEAQIDAALSAFDQISQPPLFMVIDTQGALDDRLAARGFEMRDATVGMMTPTADLAAAPPPVTCFATWPPLAIQAEIWAEGGIGPARLAIMDRVTGSKMSFFGRINDRPAGTAFVGIHDDVAMLHALEIMPAARRLGLGQIMMRTAADWALGAGASQFSVLVTRENRPARALYASLGFQAMGHYHYRFPAT
ncbi:MAG: GNAT family N-acetyltransferase [Roseicyclus sp.]